MTSFDFKNFTKNIGKYSIQFTIFSHIIGGIILLGIGCYYAFYSEKGWTRVKNAVVQNQGNCKHLNTKEDKIQWECPNTVFILNPKENKDHPNTITTTVNQKFKKGDTLSLSYNPKNPSDIDLYVKKPIGGYITIGISIFYLISALVVYLLRNNNFIKYLFGLEFIFGK